ncbi:hypothetical protein D5086_012682, partial [Populus alba]
LTTGGEVLEDKPVNQAVEKGLLVEFKKDSEREYCWRWCRYVMETRIGWCTIG